jgi:hypothetical protein
MNHSEQNRLLREILAGEETPDFRRASLETGLAALRRRRQQRQIVRAGVWLALPLALAVGILLQRSAAPVNRPRVAAVAPPATAPSVSETDAPQVKIITEEELLALFPGRTVALIGKPGHQQLLVFGRADRRP